MALVVHKVRTVQLVKIIGKKKSFKFENSNPTCVVSRSRLREPGSLYRLAALLVVTVALWTLMGASGTARVPTPVPWECLRLDRVSERLLLQNGLLPLLVSIRPCTTHMHSAVIAIAPEGVRSEDASVLPSLSAAAAQNDRVCA